MKEKIKEKAKSVCENYGGVIILTSSLFGAYILGSVTGAKINSLKIDNGLNKIFKIKPEAETLIREGIEELSKK